MAVGGMTAQRMKELAEIIERIEVKNVITVRQVAILLKRWIVGKLSIKLLEKKYENLRNEVHTLRTEICRRKERSDKDDKVEDEKLKLLEEKLKLKRARCMCAIIESGLLKEKIKRSENEIKLKKDLLRGTQKKLRLLIQEVSEAKEELRQKLKVGSETEEDIDQITKEMWDCACARQRALESAKMYNSRWIKQMLLSRILITELANLKEKLRLQQADLDEESSDSSSVLEDPDQDMHQKD